MEWSKDKDGLVVDLIIIDWFYQTKYKYNFIGGYTNVKEDHNWRV